MITIFPERPMPVLTLVVLLRRAAADDLHALYNNLAPAVFNQNMNVIRCHYVIEQAQTELFCGQDSHTSFVRHTKLICNRLT
jgi:hypothetical protein